MQVGIFGKVPQKADFVTANLPLPILRPYEQWLEAAMAASRSALGESWRDVYLIAPIWHFHFGEAVFGFACRGAIMSSVDAVGRLFPLTVFGWSPDGAAGAIAADWHDRLQAEMLVVLASDDANALNTLRETLASGTSPASEPVGMSTWWQLGQSGPTTFAGLPPRDFYTTMIGASPRPAVTPIEDNREITS
ncbi:type VI secretion system ImpM family protein [Devosia sp. UYZn731]|uniref:type VI secretion system-associated protein TagF n=1 Tax=Devosia sp. UYZn731 TaxID=3156345 RepID=UPI003396471F